MFFGGIEYGMNEFVSRKKVLTKIFSFLSCDFSNIMGIFEISWSARVRRLLLGTMHCLRDVNRHVHGLVHWSSLGQIQKYLAIHFGLERVSNCWLSRLLFWHIAHFYPNQSSD